MVEAKTPQRDHIETKDKVIKNTDKNVKIKKMKETELRQQEQNEEFNLRNRQVEQK